MGQVFNPIGNNGKGDFDLSSAADFSTDTLHVLRAGDTMTGPLVVNSSSAGALDIQSGSAVSAWKFDGANGLLTNNGTVAQDGAILGSNLVASVDFSDPTYWSPNSVTWTTTTTTCTHVVGNTTPIISTTAVLTPSAGDYLVQFTISGMVNVDIDGVTPQIGNSSGSQFRTNGTFLSSIQAQGATTLRFVPTSNFDGTISVVTVKRITNAPPRMTFNVGATFSLNTPASQLRTDFQGNTFIGKNSGKCNIFGSGINLALGDNAMAQATTAANNVAIGSSAAQKLTNGSDNFALGGQSLANLANGSRNIALGISALGVLSTASDMVGIGELSYAFFNGTVGQGIGIGTYSGRSVTRGLGQTYIGHQAGYQEITNTAWKTITNLPKSGAIGYGAQIQSSGIAVGGQGDNQMNVAFGTTSPTNFVSVSPMQYSTGTASRSGFAITGSGTTWTTAMVGSEFIFADGTKSTITAVGGTTSITCADSGTVASQIYRIHKPTLQVDGTNFRVGINTVAPTSSFQVTGSRAFSILTVTASTTLDETHSTLLVDASGGARNATLPTASTCTGREYVIKKIDSSVNAVTIVGTVDGTVSPTLATQYKYMRVQSDGTSWWNLGSN